jgi:hypothetical protein
MASREVNKSKTKPKPSRQYEDSKAGEEQRDRLAEIVKATKPIAIVPTNKTRRMKGK